MNSSRGGTARVVPQVTRVLPWLLLRGLAGARSSGAPAWSYASTGEDGQGFPISADRSEPQYTLHSIHEALAPCLLICSAQHGQGCYLHLAETCRAREQSEHGADTFLCAAVARKGCGRTAPSPNHTA